MTAPVFGQRINCVHASDDNPNKFGYFVRAFRRVGKMNPGLYWQCTDGKGYLWEIESKYAAIAGEPPVLENLRNRGKK